MEILLFIDSLGAGGAQRQILNLGAYLVEQGYSVSVLVYHDHSFYENFCNQNKIRITRIKCKSVILRLYRCRKVLRQFRYIISFLDTPNFIASLFVRKDARLIVSERSSKHEIGRTLKDYLVRLPISRAHAIVTNSQTNKSHLTQFYKIKEQKIHVIYNSLCPPFIPSAETLPLDEVKRSKFLVVASFQEHKNQLMILKALLQLRDTDIHVDFYGGDRGQHYLAKCKKFAQTNKLKNLSFCGEIEITPDTYSNYAGLILVSEFEGMPNVVMEALSAGLQIFYTPVSDLPLILKDTDNICVPHNDNDKLAEALKNSASRPNEHLFIDNVRISKETFSLENFNSYVQLLTSPIEDESARSK